MKNHPKVTIVTPVLNAVDNIERCIESVNAQDYPNIEHIVVDGGSTDGTLDIIVKHGLSFVSEPDAGIYDAFSKGVHRSSGDIINILNADDYIAGPSIVSKVVAFMNSRNLDLCHGLVEQIDADGTVKRTIGNDASNNLLLKKMKVAHPSVFIHQRIYQKYGAFSIGFKIAGDHEFVLRIWDKIETGFLPEVIARMQLGGVSNSNVIASCRESMAASLLHGQPPLKALIIYYYECLKNIHKVIWK